MGKNRYSYWELTIRDTSIEGLMNDLSEAEIAFFKPRLLDIVTVYFCVPYGQIRQLRSVVEQRGGELLMCRPKGILPAVGRVWQRYALVAALGSDCVHAERMPQNEEFDWLVYFEDGKPDAFFYCLKDDMGHVTYHRFTREDYEAFGF